jgi:anthranilate phosphoribosyltransferase
MVGPSSVAASITDAGLAFMFAPLFHPAMARVLPVRKALKIRTIFNVLGPLLNPAGAQRLVLGVYHPRLLDTYAAAVAALGVRHALIVHCCGLDELAPLGPTQAVEVVAGKGKGRAAGDATPVTVAVTVRRLTIDPADWGVSRCSVEDLRGGSPEENAAILKRVLSGGEQAVASAVGATIALNAGAALYVAGHAASVREGYERAADVLKSGAAGATLEKWAGVTQRLAREERAAIGGGASAGGGTGSKECGTVASAAAAAAAHEGKA